MITFITSICVLILGYFLYSHYLEKIAGADSNHVTPAYNIALSIGIFVAGVVLLKFELYRRKLKEQLSIIII